MKKILIPFYAIILLIFSSAFNTLPDYGYENNILGGMSCLIIKAEVLNFETWKEHFDEDKERRAQNGIQDILVLQDVNHENHITLILGHDDPGAVEEFFSSEETQIKIARSGVLGEPTLIFWEIDGSDFPIGDYFLLIKHTVKDYHQWKKAFYNHEPVRNQHNIQLTAVGNEIDDPNLVMVMLNAKLSGQFTEFLEKSEVKSAMENAGVTSEPEFQILSIID